MKLMKYLAAYGTELPDLSAYEKTIRKWLKERYGRIEAERIWDRTCIQYADYMKDLPDLGGRRNGHALAIYGSTLIFSLYPQLPDQPPLSQVQDFVNRLFMKPFAILGRIINLNRSADMKLIDMVFQKSGDRDRRDILKYPEGFENVSEPYDEEHQASRYSFTRCPNAEFAKRHDLLHVLPLMCNCDYYGISQIHGQLIRCSTCGNGKRCDYCVVGSENPLAQEFETVTDENGFLISVRKAG